jgi:hypothetical protein
MINQMLLNVYLLQVVLIYNHMIDFHLMIDQKDDQLLHFQRDSYLNLCNL